jgi:hypothetical protein
MAYFYHAVPEQMIGNYLLPLSDMASIDPDLHEKYSAKYIDRMNVAKQKIPLLGCSWSDVVQLLPVNPRKIFELQVSMGIIPALPDYRYYQIDNGVLDQDNTAIFYKYQPGEGQYELLVDVDLSALDQVPAATEEYFKSIPAGELPFNYQFIPHVLTSKPINISEAPVFQLSEL